MKKTNKLFKHKKGETLPMEYLVIIILVLAAGILITLFMTKAYKDVSLSSDRSLCRTSVIAAGSSIILGTDSPISLKGCDTRVVDIRYGKDKKEVNGRLLRVQTQSEEEVAKIISDELAGCAWQFSEGQVNPFGDYADFGDHVRCVICSEVTFDEEIVSRMESVDLSSYMWNNNYNSKESFNINKPYNEMLGFTTEFPPLALEKDTYPVDYSIIFGMGQQNSLVNWAAESGKTAFTVGAAYGCAEGAAIGGTLGGVAGGIGAIPGGIIGCLVGGIGLGTAAGGTTYLIATDIDSAIGEYQGESRYFSASKSYDYFFVQDHQKKEGYMSAFAIIPSQAVGDSCDKLY